LIGEPRGWINVDERMKPCAVPNCFGADRPPSTQEIWKCLQIGGGSNPFCQAGKTKKTISKQNSK
jgi:hypothetical protein